MSRLKSSSRPLYGAFTMIFLNKSFLFTLGPNQNPMTVTLGALSRFTNIEMIRQIDFQI